MNRDIYYSKLGVQVAERLKTYDFKKQGNIRKISNLGDAQPTALSPPPKKLNPTALQTPRRGLPDETKPWPTSYLIPFTSCTPRKHLSNP